MHMVDDPTPYYQDRMRQLPPAQRKIVEFLCLQGRPVTIKDISASCLMSHQTAAKQIGELATAGFVSRMPYPVVRSWETLPPQARTRLDRRLQSVDISQF